MDQHLSMVEYIWHDGAKPTQQLRSKTRFIALSDLPQIEDFPEWGYDGSSTYQAPGDKSDLTLKPVNFVPDPLRGDGNYLVLCEVYAADGQPHPTNHRAKLREVLAKGGDQHEPWVGFEQEYTFFSGRNPLGWPEGGFPAPQGPFYCGVGSNQVFGREIVEAHTMVCLEAGLMLFGTNAEVMPGQWEFQVGYRGIDGESADPVTVSDHVWLARWLLHRVSEDFNVTVSFDNKPIKGDWNGAGMHTNFSTKDTRNPETGLKAIEKAVMALGEKHGEHIEVYGDGLAERLTGLHETCSITQFRSGVSDRGASIRIPLGVSRAGYGYFEDRRPGANANPYQISIKLIQTICGID